MTLSKSCDDCPGGGFLYEAGTGSGITRGRN